ncbi:hypothetical protein M404DRAFT_141141 [Pisolithus tinctorius Marx 270]|uniref:Uncharacterized protein n=1 Tax=Pisolithus tinctorius Marx 270 TaxID=870435 RepID=A0A0C3J8V9_PISTI|nr:hypothetical protein M404DRAFT_141141 [Pisolithus tinctorius Marx 270]
MVPTGESGPGCHPYGYARVLGIYHVYVRLLGRGEGFQNLHVLWVRWLGVSPGHRFHLAVGHLPKIGFVPTSDPAAFGFLDPNIAIHAVHLILAFTDGKGTHLLPAGKSVAQREGEEDDWVNFYVNM